MVFRRNNRLHPVNSIKHVVDIQGGLTIDTSVEHQLVEGVDAPVHTADSDHVRQGSVVNSIFLNVQFAATSTAALANIYMFVYGNPGGNIPAGSIPKGNAIGISDFRSMVFHQEMSMSEKNTTAIPRTLFKGVLKLPRKFRRIGMNNQIGISLYSPGVTFDYCIQAIYKEIN